MDELNKILERYRNFNDMFDEEVQSKETHEDLYNFYENSFNIVDGLLTEAIDLLREVTKVNP